MVLATGAEAAHPGHPRYIDHPMVLSYAEVLAGVRSAHSVAVIGAGGIGFDVSEFLVTDTLPP